MKWDKTDMTKDVGQDVGAAQKQLGLTVIAFAPVVGTKLSTSQVNPATGRNALNVAHK